MRLFAVSGETVAMFSGRMKKPPETFEHDGRTWRVTSFLPSRTRCEKPLPGILDLPETIQE